MGIKSVSLSHEVMPMIKIVPRGFTDSMMAEEVGLSPAELEQMLLNEETTADQLSAMRKSLDSLLKKVDSLTARGTQESRQPAGAECSTSAPPIVYEQLNVGDFDNVEYHLGFLIQWRRRKQGKTTEWRPRTRDSSQSSSIPCRSRVTLKERDLMNSSFERFTMKYQSLGLRNDLLTQLLLSKLQGYPKAVAKSLPKLVREGNFESLVEALRAKLAVDNSAMQMKAYLDLKHLKKRGGVTEFCLELERLSREAYPDASEEELSRTRAGELVSQLTDWPEYLQLFTTMEIAPKEQAYDMVKAMAQRCERSKQVAAAMRNAMEGHARKSQNGRLRKVDRSHDARQVQTTVNTLESGSSKLDVRDATAQRRPVGKCFNCNKQGHLKKDCTMPMKNATVTEKVTRSAQQAEPARIFTASLRKWICGAVEVDNKCELVGEQTTTDVHLLGTSRKALLDTGSQISIIPLQVLQAALESGFDLDADVEEIPLDQQKQVFDASGNRMSFKGAIRLTLQMSDGKKQRIAAFVMAGGDGMLVLGTNALRPLGYDLAQRNCSESVALPSITVGEQVPVNERGKKARCRRSKPPCSLFSDCCEKGVHTSRTVKIGTYSMQGPHPRRNFLV
ncbi:zinc knuckle [Cooperia oncophora]